MGRFECEILKILQTKPKKACILIHFFIIILFKGKAISYHLGFAEE